MYSGVKQRQALAKSNFKLKLAVTFGVLALVCAAGAFVSLCCELLKTAKVPCSTF